MRNEICDCGRRYFVTRKLRQKVCFHCMGRLSSKCRNSKMRKLREDNAYSSHTTKQWMAVIVAQDGLCFYCHSFIFGEDGGFRGNKDHAIPLSRGGSNHIMNIVAACAPCNRDKGSQTFEEFMYSEKRIARMISTHSTDPSTSVYSGFLSTDRFTDKIDPYLLTDNLYDLGRLMVERRRALEAGLPMWWEKYFSPAELKMFRL